MNLFTLCLSTSLYIAWMGGKSPAQKVWQEKIMIVFVNYPAWSCSCKKVHIKKKNNNVLKQFVYFLICLHFNVCLQMPSCSGRNLLYAILALQLISTLERQVFDFLGFMWIPILSNFVHTLVVILGIFGVYQYTSIHLLTYLVWCLLWSAWNIFVICYYMDIG